MNVPQEKLGGRKQCDFPDLFLYQPDVLFPFSSQAVTERLSQ